MGKIVGLVFEEKTKVSCPQCGKEYATAEGLAKHISKEHPDNNRQQPPTQGEN